MKSTALTAIHEKLGAKMVEFAGYRMPLEYSGVTNEHLAVRNSVGVFDVSHMGEFWVKGPESLNLLQKVTTNDVSSLKPGKAQYSCMPNGKGGIVDDLLIYLYEPQKYMLVVNASNMEKDWEWLNRNNTMDAELEDASGRMSLLAVQGPNALKVVQELTDTRLSELKSFSFAVTELAGMEDVIVSTTGYTGAGGVEIYCGNEQAETLWNALFEAGKKYDIQPIGLAARDTLRLEMGYCLYGNDIDDTTSPIEAGLGWITKFKDGKDFIDRDFLSAQLQNGVTRKLVGFEMEERGIPRHNYAILDEKGNTIGEVTSGTMSPVMKNGIGMGYIALQYAQPGNKIFIEIRNKKLQAKVVTFPIFKG